MTEKDLIKNWKQGVHLIFRTKRFGVNNEWWSNYDSMFGRSIWWRIKAIILVKPLWYELQYMMFRVYACHFLAGRNDEKIRIFGWSPHKFFGYRS